MLRQDVNRSGVLAIDIGGTKLAAAVVTESGTILASARVRTPRTQAAGRDLGGGRARRRGQDGDGTVAADDAQHADPRSATDEPRHGHALSAATESRHGQVLSAPDDAPHAEARSVANEAPQANALFANDEPPPADAPVAADEGQQANALFAADEARRADALFTVVVALCRRVLEQAATPVAAIGVGCGGPMGYPEGIVSPLNIPAWRGFPLRARLSAAFGGLPCVVDNDAKALALGEQWRGAGRGSNNLLGMVVSTGVGAGLILDGRLLHGEHGNAGHVGHIIVWPGGPACRCGARGCVEAIASGTGLAQRLADIQAHGVLSDLPLAQRLAELQAGQSATAQAQARRASPSGRVLSSRAAAGEGGAAADAQPGESGADQPPDAPAVGAHAGGSRAGRPLDAPAGLSPDLPGAGRLADVPARSLLSDTLPRGASAVEIAAAARAGDELAMELFRTAGEAVGRGIASAAALLDLDLVVVGGSVALRAWDLLGPPLEAELRATARLDFTRDVQVRLAELGDDAGLFGAARLALDARS